MGGPQDARGGSRRWLLRPRAKLCKKSTVVRESREGMTGRTGQPVASDGRVSLEPSETAAGSSAEWSNPVARQAHNLEVARSNRASATKIRTAALKEAQGAPPASQSAMDRS